MPGIFEEALAAIVEVSRRRQLELELAQETEMANARTIIEAAVPTLAACAAELDPNDEDTVLRSHLMRTIRLFELGEFRRYTLHNGTGWSSLYIGEDGRFYVYRPEYPGDHSRGTAPSGVRVIFNIRPLSLDDMDYHETMACLELCSRPWII
jgi:hypothetical protein